jgi:hypothetical protein
MISYINWRSRSCLSAAALEEAAKQPEDDTAGQTLVLQLRKALQQDPALRAGLAEVLPPAEVVREAAKIVQSTHNTGAGSVNIQAGDKARIRVERAK